MKRFRILFYKAEFGDGKYLDDGISAYTTFVNALGLLATFKFKDAAQVILRRYSHVEVWWPDGDGDFGGNWSEHFTMPSLIVGQCFTSTTRGEHNGTVRRPASKILKHPERWNYIEIEVTNKMFDRARKWAMLAVKTNKGYNKRTILDFFNPFRRTKKPQKIEKNICSVAVMGFLVFAGIFKVWMIWSPIKLWHNLDKLGYETKSL